jgi:alpha-amylase/alpha-mannosidase (GH57 family)
MESHTCHVKNCKNASTYYGTPLGCKKSIPAEGVFSCDQHIDVLINTYYDINKKLNIKKIPKKL